MPDNRAIANAVERWSEELVDIGGRNRLLFYKPLRSGTIDFRPNEDADEHVVEGLLDGDAVRLSDAVPGDERIMRRGRAIRQKSREHEEEQGIRTLHLGRYLASWSDKPGREPAAPIFLSAVEITALGRLGDDFEIKRVDDWELNPVLLHYLQTDFQVQFDEGPLRQAVDDEQWSHAVDLFRSATIDVAGIEVADRVVLATFSYAKLPLVRDLEEAHEAIGAHQLVAGLAGDPSARDQLQNVHPGSFGGNRDAMPDDPPPEDEFLILDADGSQSRVINAALQGQNLVVVGPPGTGKSQTIANLIATLAAQGKSALFVAEKRAAIDAVTKRLKSAGLEDLVLDLHEGVRSRRDTAAQLTKALETARRTREPQVRATHRRLTRSRQALSRKSHALHRKHEPWRLSVFDIWCALIQVEQRHRSTFRFRRRSLLRTLTRDEINALAESLREYITVGGAELGRDRAQLWSSALRNQTVTTDDQREAVEDALEELITVAKDRYEGALQAFCEEHSIQSPATLREVDSMLAALDGCQQAGATLAAELDIVPPSTLSETENVLAVLEECEHCVAAFTDSVGIDPRTSFSGVVEVLQVVEDFQRALTAFCGELGVEPPSSVRDVDTMVAAFDEHERAGAAFASELGISPLPTLNEVDSVIEALEVCEQCLAVFLARLRIDPPSTLEEADGILQTLADYERQLASFCVELEIEAPSSLRDVDTMLAALERYEQTGAKFASELGIEPLTTLSEFESVLNALRDYEQGVDAFSGELGIEPPSTLKEVEKVWQALTECERTLDALAAELGLDPPSEFDDIDLMLNAVDEFDKALRYLKPDALGTDLAALHLNLTPVMRSVVSRAASFLLSGTYRRARLEARSLARSQDNDLGDIRKAISHAQSGLEHWRRLAGDGSPPASWDACAEFHASLDHWQSLAPNSPAALTSETRARFVDVLERWRHFRPSETVAPPQDMRGRFVKAVAQWRVFKPSEVRVSSGVARSQLNAALERWREFHPDPFAVSSDVEQVSLRMALDRLRAFEPRNSAPLWRQFRPSATTSPSQDVRDRFVKALERWRVFNPSEVGRPSEAARERLKAVLDRWRDFRPDPAAAPWGSELTRLREAVERLREFEPRDSAPLTGQARGDCSRAVEQWRVFGSDPRREFSTDARANLESALRDMRRYLPVLVENAALGDVEAIRYQTLANMLDRLYEQRGMLRRLPRLHELHDHLSKGGLAGFVQTAAEQRWNADDAAQSLEYAWRRSVLDEISVGSEVLHGLDASDSDDTVVDFCQSDREHVSEGSARVRRAWAEAIVTARNAYPDQESFIIRESRRKRRHRSMRQLVQIVPEVLMKLKPCWAMSPLVVPQILPREQFFDVVIFDEASQVLPADAVSSLLRGKHAVIAGDPKQLPPTTFFTSTSDDYEDEEEEDDDGAEFALGPLTNDVESVLDAVSALMSTNSRTLNWHYRSLDERLIAFSNHHIYEGSLTTFPGLLSGDCVAHVEVPVSHESIASGGSNSAEVRQVVDLILEHAERRSDESLGVIAFGLKHAHRIEEALRLARKDHPELDEFFSEDRPEPFFVKNLERVQGDERDAIILTVGYGRAQDGRMRYTFGPLNREGGYRRLNVAVTRSKRRMTVVSAFSAADMDPDKLTSQGPQMLRDYVAYAASAGRNFGSVRRDAEPLNPFEIDIKNRLEAQGIPLQPQYGASGYWIDIAAMHPDQPGRPVLAIEADGARYHSAINARERDRLRQEHLERLGWRFHRIWSTAWFRDPEAEVGKVVQAWKNAVADADRRAQESLQEQSAEQQPPPTPRPPAPAPSARGRYPHVGLPGRPIVEYSNRQLDDMVLWAKSDGLLHSDDEMIRDIARAMGYRRVGSRIRDYLERAITRVDRKRRTQP